MNGFDIGLFTRADQTKQTNHAARRYKEEQAGESGIDGEGKGTDTKDTTLGNAAFATTSLQSASKPLH